MTCMTPTTSPSTVVGNHADWSYEVAFSRNLGLVDAAEQEVLRKTTVAIAGLGGVGGVHLMTLARLGVGGFHIADPDHFEAANFNRQYGALLSNLGHAKTDVMADAVQQVNPEIRLKSFEEPIDEHNVAEFLNGADIYIDGVDFFSFAARQLLFAEARRRGMWAITAGPLGMSTAWLVFDPRGMSFAEYFDLRDDMTPVERTAALAVGLCPAGLHLPYLDLKHVDLKSGRGPSTGLACQLCAGVAAAEVLKIRLGRGPVRAAPYYFQFDAYRQKFGRGRLWWGNRHPLQRLKRRILERRLQAAGVK
jgi:molybdopterin/thiamine biosynthesis adenylyltransferase